MGNFVYANPLEDVGFKVLFGPKTGKTNMINLLRALLPDLDIEDLNYLDTEQTGLTPEEGRSVFDMSVLLRDGTRVVVEMQKANLRHFNYRAVYYSSHAIQSQARSEREHQHTECESSGRERYWDYYFKPVYVIGILQHGMGGSDNAGERYLEHYRLLETSTGKDMKVDLNYIYLYLDRYGKGAEESGGIVDRFAYTLKHIHALEEMPEPFGDSPEMVAFYESAYMASLPSETRHDIETHRNMTTHNDILVAIAEAKEDAAREGHAAGLAAGLAEGRAEGRAEGQNEAKLEGARNLKALGVSIDIICKAIGLSESEVAAL